jgi:hypothetical protein
VSDAEVWTCPKCGARLVTRNLWHSCGSFTLEGLFAGSDPSVIRASFALHRWLKSPRVTRKQDYGPKWRAHFVPIRSVGDLDDELKAWLQESHDVVGVQQGRPTSRS